MAAAPQECRRIVNLAQERWILSVCLHDQLCGNPAGDPKLPINLLPGIEGAYFAGQLAPDSGDSAEIRFLGTENAFHRFEVDQQGAQAGRSETWNGIEGDGGRLVLIQNRGVV